ncbi:MAG: 50S ribosomal protein L18 [Verrucomicrobiales bacterium]|jgi:large subunit ribosomal protein L18|nr:50S ribosomal protein L18 [Verrucomicrobiales bacterium]
MKASRKTKTLKHARIHERVRKKVSGSGERPRLTVSFTGQHIYAQIIDDTASKTIVSVNTTEKALAGEKLAPNVKSATKVGSLLAERAKGKNVSAVVFDRGGLQYHGKVKALADAAREGGLNF